MGLFQRIQMADADGLQIDFWLVTMPALAQYAQ